MLSVSELVKQERHRLLGEVPSYGLAKLLAVAAAESGAQGRALPGLTMLSHVAADVGHPGIEAPMSPTSLVAAPRRVGLRPIENAARNTIVPLGAGTAASQPTELQYEYYCDQYDVKANSGVRQMLRLPSNRLPADIVSIDCRGNFVGDRGVLPLLEVARACPNLTALNFADNGLKNTAVEAIAEFVISAQLPKLTTISVANNRVTIGAGIVLHEAARRCPRLLVIDTSGTRIEPGLNARIQEQLRTNVARADAAAAGAAATVKPVAPAGARPATAMVRTHR